MDGSGRECLSRMGCALRSVRSLDALREVSRSEVELDELRWKQIAAAQDAGASWAALGEACGDEYCVVPGQAAFRCS